LTVLYFIVKAVTIDAVTRQVQNESSQITARSEEKIESYVERLFESTKAQKQSLDEGLKQLTRSMLDGYSSLGALTNSQSLIANQSFELQRRINLVSTNIGFLEEETIAKLGEALKELGTKKDGFNFIETFNSLKKTQKINELTLDYLKTSVNGLVENIADISDNVNRHKIIAAGSSNEWKIDQEDKTDHQTIRIEVQTEEYGILNNSNVIYFASLWAPANQGGGHWKTIGATSIYPFANGKPGFYVGIIHTPTKKADELLEDARKKKWQLNWIAIKSNTEITDN
jgi:hypothetical protein